jgi:hypothetical protein
MDQIQLPREVDRVRIREEINVLLVPEPGESVP